MTKSKLDDKEYIFAMLAALVKREGGEIRLTEEEIASVTKDDVIALMYDTRTGEVVLKIKGFRTKLSDVELSALIFAAKDDKYEN